MKMEGGFEERFSPRYQRNNKGKGNKNIRCFPQCCERGHLGSGFCGGYLTLSIKNVEPLGPNELIRCWGYFTLVGADNDMLVGQEMKLAAARLKEHSRTHPLRPWIRGEASETSPNSYKIVFNRQLLGWHYSWTSTKHTCDAHHVFKALVFILDQSTTDLRFIGAVSSPQFQLYSRRRQQQMNELKKAEERAAEQEGNYLANPSMNIPPSSSGPSGSGKRRQALDHTGGGDELGGPLRKKVNVNTFTYVDESVAKRNVRSLILDRLIRFLLSNSGQDTIIMDKPIPTPAQVNVPEPNDLDDISQSLLDTLFELDSSWNPNSQNYATSVSASSGSSMDMSAQDPSSSGHPFGNMNFNTLIQENPAWINSNESVASSGAKSDDWLASVDENMNMFERLRTLVKEKGTDATKAKIDQTITSLYRMTDSIIAVSTNRKDFADFIEKWSTPHGVQTLKTQIEEEKKVTGLLRSFVNTGETVKDGDESTLSIYADMRNLFRNVLLEALALLGADVDDFEEPMELSARYGLLNADPFYPPSKRVAAMTHLQLYGNLNGFANQDFGSRKRKFRDETQRMQWINAYWKLRRKVFRRMMINRIIEERSNPGLPIAGPADPNWDFSGAWVNSCSEHSKILVGLTRKVGVNMGELGARLFESMWKKQYIIMNEKALSVQGDRVLLGNPFQIYILDKEPHRFTVPNPLPLAQWEMDRTYVAWLSQEHSEYFMNIISGGPTRAKHIDHYLKFGKRKILSAMEMDGEDDREDDRDRAGAFFQDLPEDATRNARVMVAKRYFLTPDKETMFVSNRVHFFDEDNAPSFTDKAAMESLFSAELPSEVAYHCQKYIKVYSGKPQSFPQIAPSHGF